MNSSSSLTLLICKSASSFSVYEMLLLAAGLYIDKYPQILSSAGHVSPMGRLMTSVLFQLKVTLKYVNILYM